jgi:hypothetical protein
MKKIKLLLISVFVFGHTYSQQSYEAKMKNNAFQLLGFLVKGDTLLHIYKAELFVSFFSESMFHNAEISGYYMNPIRRDPNKPYIFKTLPPLPSQKPKMQN